MHSVIETLKAWQPHPFVDHFTVALILIGILTDLVASIFSSRLWLRYMALTLMIAGAICAEGSSISGGWEAGRVWDSVIGPGKAVLERHAWWGDVLPWVFGVLAIWRLGVQFIGFIAPSRPVYLLAGVVAGALVIYQGHLGAVMVYDYGIGAAVSTAEQSTAPSPLPPAAVPAPEMTTTPGSAPSLLPPIPSPAPTPTPTGAGSMSSTPTPMNPAPMMSAPETGSSIEPSPAPASPAPSTGESTSASPSPVGTPSPAGEGAKNL
jgi:uncharacterized membrane protein